MSDATAGTGTRTTGLPPGLTRTLLVVEVLLVLAVSLGRSGVYAAVDLVADLTRGTALATQTAVLNGSQAPGRPWLDLVLQLLGIAFALAPVGLVAYLLHRSGESLGSLGLDRTQPGRDALRGVLLAAVIGGSGLAFYLAVHALGGNLTVVAEDLPAVWWRIPVLVLSAVENALVEEVIVLGYLMRRLTQLGWDPLHARHERPGPRQLPPVPGRRRVRRERGDGAGVRPALPALGAHHADARRPRGDRHVRLRRLRGARRPCVLAPDALAARAAGAARAARGQAASRGSVSRTT